MPHYPKGKHFVFGILLILIALGAAEVALHVVYRIARDCPFPSAARREAIRRLAKPEQGRRYNGGEIVAGGAIEVIHPYLGFVRDPAQNPNTSYLGFPHKEDDPLAPATNDALSVAIFGGSFAMGLSTTGRDFLREKLLGHGFNTRVLTVAMGGYKQPQQLHALAELLSHNASIDVVVNIDGFNEVAIPQAENLPKGVNPFYPRAWYFRMLHVSDQAILRQMGRASMLATCRKKWAEAFERTPAHSIILYALWRTVDRRLERRIKQVHEAVRKSPAPAEVGFMTTGPRPQTGEGADLYKEIATHWSSCSRLMKALCDSRGILYLHFLQPNQYFEPGRTLSKNERKVAFREDHIYRPGVIAGYPMLIAEGANLTEAGVDFHDLSFVYHDVPDDIYEDDCCHPNSLGYDIVADTIARAIATGLSKKSRR